MARCRAAWGEVELRFWEPHELHCLGRPGGHEQRLRVGHADVLAGEDHHPAGDEAGILAGLEHPGQPVDGGVGVGAPACS